MVLALMGKEKGTRKARISPKSQAVRL